MFRRLRIWRGDQRIEDPLSGKAQELFCYLLLHRQLSHHRESLAVLLWAESSPIRSRRNLRKVLWQLQATLNRGAGLSGQRMFLLESDWIGLNPQADIWTDAAELELAFNLVRGVSGDQLDVALAHSVQEASDLYEGDLLEGWYQDWCVLERERLQSMYLVLLDKLMRYWEVRGDYEAGLICGARALLHDRAHERTHRQLMRLHYVAGDRTGALRQFERCVAALREELGVGPSERTIWLYHQIQADALVSTGQV